ncbi:MAG: MMPL family transporter, partial [Brachybacterium sp.]|nr:MMPL family transporter [Brachybacterium sp.]
SVLLMAVLATGLLGTRVGLSQDEQFASANESSTGFAAMAEHYGAGESAPHQIVVREASADAAVETAESVPGIDRASVSGTTPDGWAVLSAVGTAQPESPEAFEEAEGLRTSLHSLAGADALVGGTTASALDVRADSTRDLLVVAPMILGVVLVVLILLLRAVVAPLVLLTVNVASSVAAIGLGLWAGRLLLDIPALDVTVPLLAFLFLVALGVDYTIFLVHRARHEAATHGTAQGMVRAVGSTGVVITSAGVVLAAVFAALGVLPLVVLGQLGLIVGLGVLLDTLVVRTVLVPALFALIGDRMWWPSRPARH